MRRRRSQNNGRLPWLVEEAGRRGAAGEQRLHLPAQLVVALGGRSEKRGPASLSAEMESPGRAMSASSR
ncbi:MAG TPA: hypothetical protein VFB92_01835 [Vicinamibacterales bacterium]|nr:hypothetical protein [Vicinamibacterales bacterium]